MVIQDEKQIQIFDPVGQVYVNSANSTREIPGYNNRYKQNSTKFVFQNSCKKLVVGSGFHKRPYCDHCKRPRHTMDICWQIHGYP